MRNLVNFVSTAGAFVMAATPLLAAGGVAHAQQAPVVRIRTADLDFTRSSAATAFDRRVDAAAGAVCRPAGVADLAGVAACKRAVSEQAHAQLRQQRRGGDPAPTWTVAGR